jgi:hypothetical protein
MPVELEAVDGLLDDPRLFEPFRRWCDPGLGRPPIPIECHLRLMFLKSTRIRDLVRRGLGLVDVAAVLPDPARRVGPAPVDVDDDHHPLRPGADRRSERPAARGRRGRGRRGCRLAVGRHDRRARRHPLPDRLGSVGSGHHPGGCAGPSFRPPVLRHAPLSRTRQAWPGRPRTGSARRCARWPARRTAGSPPRYSSTMVGSFRRFAPGALPLSTHAYELLARCVEHWRQELTAGAPPVEPPAPGVEL